MADIVIESEWFVRRRGERMVFHRIWIKGGLALAVP